MRKLRGKHGLRGRRILVVDRDRDVRDVLCELLAQRGAVPEAASNADDAILAVRAHPFDALLIEAFVWNARGGLLAEFAVRSQPAAAVLLTGDTGAEAPAPSGARVLEKPFTSRDLSDALDAPPRSLAAGP